MKGIRIVKVDSPPSAEYESYDVLIEQGCGCWYRMHGCFVTDFGEDRGDLTLKLKSQYSSYGKGETENGD